MFELGRGRGWAVRRGACAPGSEEPWLKCLRQRIEEIVQNSQKRIGKRLERRGLPNGSDLHPWPFLLGKEEGDFDALVSCWRARN